MQNLSNHPPRSSRISERAITFWSEERALTLILSLLVLHLFVMTPARILGQFVFVGSAILLLLALLSGILTMVQHRLVRSLGVAVVIGAIFFKVAVQFTQMDLPVLGDRLFTLSSLVILVVVLMQQLTLDGPVTAHRVRGAIACYLLIGIIFAFLYSLIEATVPGSFNIPASQPSGHAAHGEMFYYFSVVTLTTVGFGDISAIHPFARSLVMAEALIGTLYPAIIIARLVTMELETRRNSKN